MENTDDQIQRIRGRGVGRRARRLGHAVNRKRRLMAQQSWGLHYAHVCFQIGVGECVFNSDAFFGVERLTALA